MGRLDCSLIDSWIPTPLPRLRIRRLNSLYLHLYAYLLDAGASGCELSSSRGLADCFDALTGRFNGSSLDVGMHKALNLYKVSDPSQFGAAVAVLASWRLALPGDPLSSAHYCSRPRTLWAVTIALPISQGITATCLTISPLMAGPTTTTRQARTSNTGKP